jgi:hypothetical protein
MEMDSSGETTVEPQSGSSVMYIFNETLQTDDRIDRATARYGKKGRILK